MPTAKTVKVTVGCLSSRTTATSPPTSVRYTVSYATNGKERLEKALDLVPDLIITDLMMPDMDGLEVCRQVRANEIIDHIPIITVTAKIMEEERIKGLKAEADAYPPNLSTQKSYFKKMHGITPMDYRRGIGI